MTPALVLVANEPRAYRETIAMALRSLRPEADIVVVEPDALEAEVERRNPDVALCSHLSQTVEGLVPTWVLLYPDGANMAMLGANGQRSTARDLTLDDLAQVIQVSEI
jgi:hypothetical protein